jgi:hypothetical protein
MNVFLVLFIIIIKQKRVGGDMSLFEINEIGYGSVDSYIQQNSCDSEIQVSQNLLTPASKISSKSGYRRLREETKSLSTNIVTVQIPPPSAVASEKK